MIPVGLWLLGSGLGALGISTVLSKQQQYPAFSGYRQLIRSPAKLGKKRPRRKQELPVPSKTEMLDTDIGSVEQWIDQHFALSSAAMVATLGGLWFTPLNFVSIAVLAYLTIPMAVRSWQGVIYHHRFRIDIINLITLPLLIVSGYLPVAAFGYWLYYLGQKVMAKAKHNSQNQLSHIFQESISRVWVMKNGAELEVDFDELRIGDVVVVQSGETIPVDGTIIEGYASIDQRAITGEAQPAEKETGDEVFAFTLMLTGKISVRVDKAGEDSIAAQVQTLLGDATNYAAAVELRVEGISDRLAFPSLLLGALAWPVAGYTSALVVLDSALIDHLNITGNINVLSHLSKATRQRLLIKDGRALERLKYVDTIVFDKTGTLTEETPHVGKVYAVPPFTEQDVLIYAATAEYKQQHPIARAILKRVEDDDSLTMPVVDDAHLEVGYGIRVSLGEQSISVGSARYMELEAVPVPQGFDELNERSGREGLSLVYVAVDGKLAGVIELHPTIRPEVGDVVQQLKAKGISSLYILSGDHEKPTKSLAEKLGMQYFAETMPQDKAAIVSRLQQEGRTVCFVGDGINDAIALKQADVSVSLNNASSIATDTAQIVLMDDNLREFVQMFELSASMERNFKRSLLWDVVPNLINIGGAFFFHLGVYGAMVVYSVGLVGGVINGLMPALDGRIPRSLPDPYRVVDKT